jgi:hypothetical protein
MRNHTYCSMAFTALAIESEIQSLIVTPEQHMKNRFVNRVFLQPCVRRTVAVSDREVVRSRLTKIDNARIWDLMGLSVTRIIIDPAQVTLFLNSGFVGDVDEVDLILENSFTIRKTDGTTHVVNPAIVETLGPVLTLRLREALSLVAARDGSLSLRFAEGVELEIRKHDQYDAWHTFGSGHFADANMLCSAHEGTPWGE